MAAFSSSSGFLLSSWKPTYGMNYFDTIDYLCSNWFLPLGGLFIAIYAGWVMTKRVRDADLEGLAPELIDVWLILVRFVAPILVLLVVAQKTGLIRVDEYF